MASGYRRIAVARGPCQGRGRDLWTLDLQGDKWVILSKLNTKKKGKSKKKSLRPRGGCTSAVQYMQNVAWERAPAASAGEGGGKKSKRRGRKKMLRKKKKHPHPGRQSRLPVSGCSQNNLYAFSRGKILTSVTAGMRIRDQCRGEVYELRCVLRVREK